MMVFFLRIEESSPLGAAESDSLVGTAEKSHRGKEEERRES